MNEKLILDILGQIEGRLLWLLVKLILAGVIVMMLKGFIQSVVAYLQFALNRRLGLGVKVKIRGVAGKITDYNLRWIIVATEEGEEIIATRRWHFEKWTTLNGKK